MTTGFSLDSMQTVFGNDVIHDETKASASLTHTFGEEDFLRGHFPGFPVVPGVILLDGMILAAAHLSARRAGVTDRSIGRMVIDSAAFYRPVLPGMAVRFTARADVSRQEAHGFSARCAAMVGETRHARANVNFHSHGD